MEDLTGKRFNSWTVLSLDTESNKSARCWICRCDCGKVKSVFENNLKKGISKSCRCKSNIEMSQRFTTHGSTKTRLYSVWFGMKRRCNDPKIPNYKSYGGRGITVCDEWLDFAKFKEWAISTGYDENAPFGQCTIERIDVNGNYEPDNCTWKNMKEQGNNRRTNKLLTYNGKTQSISEWTDEMGYARHIIKNRLRRGWSVERAITTPVGEYKWHQNSK